MRQEIVNTIRVVFAVGSFAIIVMCDAHPLFAQTSAVPSFQSADAAVQNLFKAVQSNDAAAIENVLGVSSDLASSHDDAEDKADRERFAKKYEEMHRLRREPDGSLMLYIGAENWPFPIPIVQKNGAWQFDADRGKKEVMFRRIGKNEFAAIETCQQLASAQKQSVVRSSAANEADSPLATLASQASKDPAGALINGYYFRVLTSENQGSQVKRGNTDSLVVVAYPAEYRSSGVMTFIITGNDVVYEKDLGNGTSAIASKLAAFRKDATWRPVEN